LRNISSESGDGSSILGAHLVAVSLQLDCLGTQTAVIVAFEIELFGDENVNVIFFPW